MFDSGIFSAAEVIFDQVKFLSTPEIQELLLRCGNQPFPETEILIINIPKYKISIYEKSLEFNIEIIANDIAYPALFYFSDKISQIILY